MSSRTLDRALGQLGELLERHEGTDTGRDLSAYRDDPIGFIRDVLDAEPWDGQVRIANAVRDHPQVTVRSCHAAGKDWLAARLALWWTYARGGLVVLTGPTATQVQEILMRGEVRDAFVRAGLSGSLHVNALRPGGEGRAGILAKTATGVSALTGFHESRVLFVVTEAQDPEIDHSWDAAFACTTGEEDRILTVGNPTERSGRFYRAHQPSSGWRSIKIAASDVPNVRAGRTVVPGLLTRRGVERFAREYGEESGFYVSRVLAEFPEQSEDGLFRREWLEKAADLHDDGSLEVEARDRQESPVAALDPARYGPDASVLAIREGAVVQKLVVWQGREDTMALVERTRRALTENGFRPRPEHPPHEYHDPTPDLRGHLIVDEIGVGGGVCDRLQELRFSTEGFNAGRRANESERFFNRRAEVFWELRKRVEHGELALPRDEPLFEELLSVRWRPTGSGQIQLESKRDLKGRIGRSPDRADALAMTLATETTGQGFVGAA